MRVLGYLFLAVALAGAAVSAEPAHPPEDKERPGARNANPDDLGLSGYTLNLVGHAHIDLAYRWRWNETLDRIVRDTFGGVLDLMRQEPGLTFAQSQMVLYDAVKREYPDLYREIRERVAEGRWTPVGGAWCEPDMIFPSGESFIRQRLIGMQFARQEFGIGNLDILWVPDSFCGHASTLPKILSRCGIRYYVVGRGAPKDTPIFWWETPGGGRILAYAPAAPYNLQLAFVRPEALGALRPWFEKACGVDTALILYGAGDHGGGPRRADIEQRRALETWRGAPRTAYDTPEAYFRNHVEPYQDRFPIHHGALGGLTNTSYLSQARNKQMNRECENLLETAEKFATLGTFCQRKPGYPRADFAGAWKTVLFNQFHDLLAGTSNGRAHDDSREALQESFEEARQLLAQGLEHIGARVNTRGEGIPLLVFNPLSWRRSGVVEADAAFPEAVETFVITDDAGGAVPHQGTRQDADGRRWRVVFLARDVPSVGYRMFRIHSGRTAAAATGLEVSSSVMENENLRVTFSATGALLSVFDKASGREALGGEGDAYSLIEETFPSSSWVSVLGNGRRRIEPVGTPEIVESGPVRAAVRRRFRTEDSVFTVDTLLCAGARRVEFELRADWHDKDATLVVDFPTSVEGGSGAIDAPYGFEEAKPDGARRCAQQWVDLSNAEHGVSLLNTGRHEFYLDGATLRMGVLRGARDMDPRMDEGEHRVRYALYPHAGDWRDAEAVRQAYELNNPLVAMQESHHTGETDSWLTQRCDFSLPGAHSFLEVSSGSVVVPVVKIPQAEWTANNELIVRVFETSGRATECELALAFDIVRAVETDHLEEEVLGEVRVENGKVRVQLGPSELKTLKLRLAGSSPGVEGN